MEKKDYSALDAHILKSIGAGNSRFADIHLSGHSGQEFTERETDRRLQALRKKGLIEFLPRGIGWKLAKPKKSMEK
jgi:hypothetical protein